MTLSPRLALRQSQSLVMTPQLQQSIKLLRLSGVELTAYVEAEIERNPLLERDESGAVDLAAAAGGFDAPAAGPGLRQHLVDQLNVDVGDPVDRAIGLELIALVDDIGYLDGELADVADRLGCPLERVEATLARLQQFDPTGVFARDLAECLALQLAERGRLDRAMRALLASLDMIAAGDLAGARRRCRLDEAAFAARLAEIQRLDPKPGLAFATEAVPAVVPDVLVRAGRDGDWTVELNPATLPRVLVNQRYYGRVRRDARSKADKAYLTDCLQSANWLVRALDQRATTLLKVAGELVHRQAAFLEHGVERLRPLTLRHVAEAIEMHESTVSRVTANKYVETPRGLFEMRHFFSSAVAGTDGEALSSAAVKHRIKALIASETADSPLSDDRLARLLRGDGIDVARRTVAKYREAMQIPSSMRRRRNNKGRGC